MTQDSTPIPGGGLRRLYRDFWHYAKGNRRTAVGFLLLLTGAQLVRLSIPFFFGRAVNALQDSGAQDLRAAGTNLALMFGACLLAWLLHGPGRILERFVAGHIRERFADALYVKALSLPMAWHEANHSGETIHRISKATSALSNFAQHQFVYLQNLISVVGPLIALCLISLTTGLTAILGYGLIALMLLNFDGMMIRIIQAGNEAERKYNSSLMDCLGNFASVLALRLQGPTRRMVQARMREVTRWYRQSVVVNEVKWFSLDLLNNALKIGLVGLFAWLGWRQGGIVPLGTAVMVYKYSEQIGGVVGSMAGHWRDLVRYKTDIASADTILDTRPQAARTGSISPDWRSLGVHGLTYAAARDGRTALILDRVSLELARGQRIALIGESGAGKSTLLRVLAGLYQTEHGRMQVDGIERADLHGFGPVATLIPQDPEIFEASVRDNITLGHEHPEAAVQRACELAGLMPILDQLPAGLDTLIVERGANLSGGQTQRLSLARGILAARSSSLIMLDEPTSSLDPSTEALVYDNLLAEFPEACVVSSIHRLHLLSRFDLIVLMDGGQIIEVGSLEQLLADSPRFQALWANYQGRREALEAVPVLAA